MPTKKYDWNALKTEFMTSSHITVAPFNREKFGDKCLNGSILQATMGWGAEKEKMMESVRAQVMAEAKAKMVKIYRPSIEELGSMHKATMELYKASLSMITAEVVKGKAKGKDILPNLTALHAIWNVVKVEKGEATSISEVGNTTIDQDRQDSINELLKEIEDDELKE